MVGRDDSGSREGDQVADGGQLRLSYAGNIEQVAQLVELAEDVGYDGLPTRDPGELAAWFDQGARRVDLERYLDAFERYDMEALKALLHEDATQTMPPYDLWLRGRDEVIAWMVGPGAECEGSRLIPTEANGMPAVAQYRRAASGDGHEAWALQVVEIRDGRIVGLNAFLDTARLFPLFGLPLRL